jgi:hypothetical protein
LAQPKLLPSLGGPAAYNHTEIHSPGVAPNEGLWEDHQLGALGSRLRNETLSLEQPDSIINSRLTYFDVRKDLFCHVKKILKIDKSDLR